MNVEDLWIGDRLLVKTINETGTFEGQTSQGLLKVKLEIGEVEASKEDVELVPELEKKPKVILKNLKPAKTKLNGIANKKDEIDLHIEALLNGSGGSPVKNALSFQLEKCRNFIIGAIERKERHITIIHGKGAGILRKEVYKLLNEFEDKINLITTTNKEGAILVYLK